MYQAVFQDAAGKEVYKILDTARTMFPVNKVEAVDLALRRFNAGG